MYVVLLLYLCCFSNCQGTCQKSKPKLYLHDLPSFASTLCCCIFCKKNLLWSFSFCPTGQGCDNSRQHLLFFHHPYLIHLQQSSIFGYNNESNYFLTGKKSLMARVYGNYVIRHTEKTISAVGASQGVHLLFGKPPRSFTWETRGVSNGHFIDKRSCQLWKSKNHQWWCDVAPYFVWQNWAFYHHNFSTWFTC